MATKARSKGARAGKVSLADADRQYIKESLSRAKARLGAAAAAIDERGLFEALERFGLGSERVERLRAAIHDVDVREAVDKASEYLAEQIENARDYTRENPKKVIGGAAGVLVGASLLALAIRRAAGEEKRSPTASSKKSSAASSKKAGSKKKAASKKGGSKARSAKRRGAPPLCLLPATRGEGAANRRMRGGYSPPSSASTYAWRPLPSGPGLTNTPLTMNVGVAWIWLELAAPTPFSSSSRSVCEPRSAS
ncbi:MAG TPA: hypothetical protein VNA04_10635, partial [Thermoanaerobaculia bacterium]|nr:hypothetical protein [Thermoanaerobaculia bacterium]